MLAESSVSKDHHGHFELLSKFSNSHFLVSLEMTTTSLLIERIPIRHNMAKMVMPTLVEKCIRLLLLFQMANLAAS